MAPEKAGGTRRRGGAGRGKSEPVEPAAGKDAAPSTPWSTSTPGALWRSYGSTLRKASLPTNAGRA